MNAKSQTTRSSPHQVIDARLLGRPVHLLPQVAAKLHADLDELFRSGMNTRYRASFGVESVTVACAPKPVHVGRWLRFASDVGSMGFAIERNVLLAALHYRYGQRGNATQAPSPVPVIPTQPVRETATEERLACMLGLQFVAALAARIDAMPGIDAPVQAFANPIAGSPPANDTWTVEVRITESTLNVAGTLWLTLDEAWMARLLQRLAPQRDKPRDSATTARPFAARLQLTLTGRLLQSEWPLGTLLDLRVGAVLPLGSIGPTEVLVDDLHLFDASVVEHAGKLCLTSFIDAK